MGIVNERAGVWGAPGTDSVATEAASKIGGLPHHIEALAGEADAATARVNPPPVDSPIAAGPRLVARGAKRFAFANGREG